MKLTTLDTVYVEERVWEAESTDDFKRQVLPLLKKQKERWSEKISSAFENSSATKTAFSKACGVSRVTLDKWLGGTSLPGNRETFIRIGLAAGYGAEELDNLLQRYGRYPGLYPKTLEDCVAMFVINSGGTDMADRYVSILDRIRSNITPDPQDDAHLLKTTDMREKLSQIKNEDELEKFINENSRTFATAFSSFYAYVRAFIDSNYKVYARSLNDLSLDQEWSSSLKHAVYEIYRGEWQPSRNKIISLGLHLSMDVDQINEMLNLARMEDLYPKNVFESAIMFIVSTAEVGARDSEEYDPDELCEYAREVIKELEPDIPELGKFLDELPRDHKPEK